MRIQIQIPLVFTISALILYCGRNKRNEIVASGTIEAREVTVAAEVAGKIVSVFVEEGDVINRGDPICQIDPENYQLKKEEALASLKLAEAQYHLILKGARGEEIEAAEELVNQAKASLENAESNLKRIEKLYQGNVVSKELLDNARTAQRVAKAQYESALDRLQLLKKGSRAEEIKVAEANYERTKVLLKLAEKQLEKTSVKAPIAGTVTTRSVEVGELVGTGTPIVTLANLQDLYLNIYLNEIDVGRVALGDEVRVKVDSYPKRSFKGKVVYISPEAEFTPKNIQTKEERVKLVFQVKVKVDNSEGLLKAGIPADAEILLGERASKK